MRFHTTVQLEGKTATGLAVPDEIVAALDAGKRPKVLVTVGAHSYRTTIASMRGQFLVPLSVENRLAAGVTAGDEVEVTVELDESPRVVELPSDFAEALSADDVAGQFFEALSFTYRKEWARWIVDAKKAETRAARIERAVASLRAGQRTH